MNVKTQSSSGPGETRLASAPAVVEPSVVNFIKGLSRSVLGRCATAEEIGQFAGMIAAAGGGRTAAVSAMLLMEEAVVRLASPWFWKLLSRGPADREMSEFVGTVRSGTPFDAAISRVITSEQYIQRAAGRGIGGSDGDVNLVQSIEIDLLGRLAESGELSRNMKQLRAMGCSRFALEILRSVEFRRNYVVRLHHEVLERTPVEAEMQGWLKRENLGLDLLQIRVQLLAGDEYFDRWQQRAD